MWVLRELRWGIAVLVLAAGTRADAEIIRATAFGNELAGGTVTVRYQFNPVLVTAGIVAGPAAQEGSALAPGAFSFSVIGDTFVNPWNLTNLTSNDNILWIAFDLHGSISLFDDNSIPSTPNSAAGRFGAVRIAGPVPAGSGELIPWEGQPTNPNLGDMYWEEQILFDPNVFLPGLTFTWEDDSDTREMVPEPSALVGLIGLGALGLVAATWRRRR